MEKQSVTSSWQQWLKWIIVVFTLLFILRQIMAFSYAHFINQWIEQMAFKPQQTTQLDPFVLEVTQTMKKWNKEMDEDRAHMQKRFDGFQKSFANNLENIQKNRIQNDSEKDYRDFINGIEKENKQFDAFIDIKSKKDDARNRYHEKIYLQKKIKELQPQIACEKKLFGKSNFDPKHPEEYVKSHPFHMPIPDVCKEFRGKV